MRNIKIYSPQPLPVPAPGTLVYPLPLDHPLEVVVEPGKETFLRTGVSIVLPSDLSVELSMCDDRLVLIHPKPVRLGGEKTTDFTLTVINKSDQPIHLLRGQKIATVVFRSVVEVMWVDVLRG